MDFLNARHFLPDDVEIFELRKKKFQTETKLITRLFIFAWITTFYYCIFLSPLTESQKALTFNDSTVYLFWLMYVQTSISTILSSGLATAGSFLLSSMINYITLEFTIVGIAFERLLRNIKDDMTDIEFYKVMSDLKDYVKHYQCLLL